MAANSLQGETSVVDADFIVLLANHVFLPLIRVLKADACLQVLALLAKRYRDDVGPLATEPKPWVQPLESWLWELAAIRPEPGDDLALKTRNQVPSRPPRVCAIDSTTFLRSP